MPEPEKLEYETEMEHREDLIGSMGLIGKFVLVGFIMAFVELIQFLPALQTFAFISFVWCAFFCTCCAMLVGLPLHEGAPWFISWDNHGYPVWMDHIPPRSNIHAGACSPMHSLTQYPPLPVGILFIKLYI